jgi:hypothetical protein
MSVKSQNNFSFDEAKDVATYQLSLLVQFIEKLQRQLPRYVSCEWIKDLRNLQEKISKSSGTCLSTSDIGQVQELAQQLINFIPDISLQLSEFWYLFTDVYKCLKENPNTTYAPQSQINKMRAEIDEADTLAERVVHDLHGKASTLASTMALLPTHVGRSEKIEYSMAKQINDAIARFNLTGYDVKFMCSVQNKVRNTQEPNGWRTDVRAIRDAISHFRYSIEKSKIEFSNNTHGYSYHKTFSDEEFYHFFDLHTLLYKLQLALLTIIELVPVLATHFYKR